MAKKKIVIETKYTAKGAADVENSYEGIADSANDAAEATDNVNNSMEESGPASQKAAGGMGGLLDGMKAIVANPIGLVLVALVGAIKFVSSALSGSEDASNKLSQGFAYLGGFIQPLKDGIVSAFEFIVKAIESPGETWDALVKKIEDGVEYFNKNIFQPYLSAWKLLGLGVFKAILTMRVAWNEFTGDVEESNELQNKLDDVNDSIKENQKVITDAAKTLKDDVVGAVEAVVDGVTAYVKKADELGDKLSSLVKEEQRLVSVRREQEVQNAKALADIEKLKVVRDDEAQSLKDRIEANKEIGVIEKARVEAAISLAQAELATTRRNMELKGRSTELLDAEKDKLIELQELRSENAGIENEQVVNNTALRKEAFEKEAALIDRERELKAVLQEDAVILADAVVKAEEEKLLKLEELGLQENQIYRDTQAALALSQEEAIKARLDAEEEAAATLKDTNDKLNAQQEKDDKEAAKEKLDVRAALNSGIIGFADALTGALGENSKAALIIQKAVALRTIAIDTAQAISALVKASAQNKLNGVTGGAAGAIQFGTGLLQIGTNIAKAYSILKAPSPQIDGGGSGGGSAPETAQTAPDLGFEGRSAGAEQFGAQVIRAYVSETDITTSQDTATNIQELSQIG